MNKQYSSLEKLKLAIGNTRTLQIFCPEMIPKLTSVDIPNMTLGYETVVGHHIQTDGDLMIAAAALGRFQKLWLTCPQRDTENAFAPFVNASRIRAYGDGFRGCGDDLAATPEKFCQIISEVQAKFLYKDSNVTNFIVCEGDVKLIDFDTVTRAPLEYDLAKLLLTFLISGFDFSIDSLHYALHSFNRFSGADPACKHQLLSYMDMHWVMSWSFAEKNGYRLKWPTVRNSVSKALIG